MLRIELIPRSIDMISSIDEDIFELTNRVEEAQEGPQKEVNKRMLRGAIRCRKIIYDQLVITYTTHISIEKVQEDLQRK